MANLLAAHAGKRTERRLAVIQRGDLMAES
jgi:hypothetical protein